MELISMWSGLVSSVESKHARSCNCFELFRAPTFIFSHTYTFSGAVDVADATFCYALFGGTYCETPTQLNVPVAFIAQTSAK